MSFLWRIHCRKVDNVIGVQTRRGLIMSNLTESIFLVCQWSLCFDWSKSYMPSSWWKMLLIDEWYWLAVLILLLKSTFTTPFGSLRKIWLCRMRTFFPRIKTVERVLSWNHSSELNLTLRTQASESKAKYLTFLASADLILAR